MLPLRSNCKSERVRRLLPLGVVAIAAMIPASAQATVTQTTVDPGAKSYMPLNTDTNVFGPVADLVNVSGTAPGASDGDLVNVSCDTANGQHIMFPVDIPVDNGRWSTADVLPIGLPGFPLSLGALNNVPGSGDIGRMCNVRAVPAGTDPADRRNFAPRAVGIGRLDTFNDTGLSGAPLKDYSATSNQSGGTYQVSSAGDGGVDQSRKTYGSNFAQRGGGVFDGVANFGQNSSGLLLGANDLTNFGDPSIGVSNSDGSNTQNAFLPADQQGAPLDTFGQSDVSVQRSLDSAGNATIKESSRTRQCRLALAFLCAQYDDAGLKLDRTITTSADGVTATVVDTWTNTGGTTHRYDLRYNSVVGSPGGSTGVAANDGVPQTKSAHDTFVPGTSGAWSMVVNSDTNDPDVDGTDDHGAVTYMNAPDIVVMEDANEFESWYQRQLAPGQSFSVSQVLDQAGTVAEARSLAAAHRAAPTAAAAAAPASSGSSSPATLSSSNAKVAQAIAAALAKQSASKKSVASYSASGAIRRSKSGKRYLRVKVSGPSGRVSINIAFLNKKGASVGSGSASVKTNKKVNLRSLDIPSKARKVKITVQ